MKKHIPNLFTLSNQACGIIALIEAYNSNFEWALIFILFGAFFDFCDGAVARALKVVSPLGKELDSLADMITFGLVPGMIAFRLLAPLEQYWTYLPYIGFILTLMSAMRLANFNIDERQKDTFIGLATPANALFWGGLAVSDMEVNVWFILGCVVVFSYLLVCELPMFSFKIHSFGLKGNEIRYLFLLGVSIACPILKINAIPAIIGWYIILSLIEFVIKKKK